MNLRQAKKTLAKKVWDAAGMAGGDFAPKWVGQDIPACPSCEQQKPLKSRPTSYAVRTRPVKPLGQMFCAVGDFVPDS